MELEEAIERTEDIQMEFLPLPRHRDWEALQLLIQAGKRCQYIAEHTTRWAHVLLPGETKD